MLNTFELSDAARTYLAAAKMVGDSGLVKFGSGLSPEGREYYGRELGVVFRSIGADLPTPKLGAPGTETIELTPAIREEVGGLARRADSRITDYHVRLLGNINL